MLFIQAAIKPQERPTHCGGYGPQKKRQGHDRTDVVCLHSLH